MWHVGATRHSKQPGHAYGGGRYGARKEKCGQEHLLGTVVRVAKNARMAYVDWTNVGCCACVGGRLTRAGQHRAYEMGWRLPCMKCSTHAGRRWGKSGKRRVCFGAQEGRFARVGWYRWHQLAEQQGRGMARRTTGHGGCPPQPVNAKQLSCAVTCLLHTSIERQVVLAAGGQGRRQGLQLPVKAAVGAAQGV